MPGPARGRKRHALRACSELDPAARASRRASCPSAAGSVQFSPNPAPRPHVRLRGPKRPDTAGLSRQLAGRACQGQPEQVPIGVADVWLDLHQSMRPEASAGQVDAAAGACCRPCAPGRSLERGSGWHPRPGPPTRRTCLHSTCKKPVRARASCYSAAQLTERIVAACLGQIMRRARTRCARSAARPARRAPGSRRWARP